ncbi:MAG: M14 family metallopeptidase [Gemmatimonadales bacterium]
MSRIGRRLAFAAATMLLNTIALPAQLTVPERTHGMRTSTHAEVLAFIDSLQHRGAHLVVGTLGESTLGKRIPYLILSRPQVSTPAQAHATGKPILYIEANIHAGEVEGKEAVQMLARDLTLGYLRPLLDSVVILFVPIYNGDGNDAMGPNDLNRGEQEGPPMEGLRANGQGYDLNRDYVKQEAPETRASLAFITRWNPDLFMDLHTTDGSYHGYDLTWSPGLNPNHTPTNDWVQDTLLEQVRARLIARDHVQTYPYGNFDGSNAAPTGWRSYESLPRYGTNLQGMLRVSVLSEAMSHENFMRRIDATYDFVLETIRYANEHRVEMRRREAQSAAQRPDSVVVRGNDLRSPDPHISPVRMDSVLVAVTHLATEPRSDSAARANAPRTPRIADTVGACVAGAGRGRGGRGGGGRGAGGFGGRGGGGRGVNPGDSTRDVVELTGAANAVWMPVRDRFGPVRKESIPAAYVFDAGYRPVVALMRRIGIAVSTTTAPWTGPMSEFMVDSVVHERFFEGHCGTMVDGSWSAPTTAAIPSGSFVVSTNQRFGMLAAFLLEPASEDGYTFWNFFDAGVKQGAAAPVRRLAKLPATPLKAVP